MTCCIQFLNWRMGCQRYKLSSSCSIGFLFSVEMIFLWEMLGVSTAVGASPAKAGESDGESDVVTSGKSSEKVMSSKNVELSATWSHLKKISHGIWAVAKISGEMWNRGENWKLNVLNVTDLVFLVRPSQAESPLSGFDEESMWFRHIFVLKKCPGVQLWRGFSVWIVFLVECGCWIYYRHRTSGCSGSETDHHNRQNQYEKTVVMWWEHGQRWSWLRGVNSGEILFWVRNASFLDTESSWRVAWESISIGTACIFVIILSKKVSLERKKSIRAHDVQLLPSYNVVCLRFFYASRRKSKRRVCIAAWLELHAILISLRV